MKPRHKRKRELRRKDHLEGINKHWEYERCFVLPVLEHINVLPCLGNHSKAQISSSGLWIHFTDLIVHIICGTGVLSAAKTYVEPTLVQVQEYCAQISACGSM